MDENQIGTIFDLENAGVWFDYGTKGSKVCLRNCNLNEIRKIEKITVKDGVEYKELNGKLQRITFEDPNKKEESDMMWNYCIVDWKNFNRSNGEIIECNSETKKELIGKSATFLSFCNDKLEFLRKDEDNVREESEKNL